MSHGGSKRRRDRDARVLVWLTTTAVVAALSAVALPSPAAAGSLITVTTTASDGSGGCSLSEAIIAANTDSNEVEPACAAGSGDDSIGMLPGTYVLTGPYDDRTNYMGATATPMITSNIDIVGNGAVIQHAANNVPYRAFAVDAFASLTLREVHVKGFSAKGGDGGGGGGGGLGAGGAIYVESGSLTIDGSVFEGNHAQGGNGSTNGTDSSVAGGGGGLGGDGGEPFFRSFAGGGGGGGARGDGGTGDVNVDFAGRGGGGGGTIADGESGTIDPDDPFPVLQGGYDCGGDGGWTDIGFGGADGEAGCLGGGGGGGETYRQGFVALTDGNGGDGGDGGGGGGAAYDVGSGGHGGFGGGGGAGTTYAGAIHLFGPVGGDGGFGGGGGSGVGGSISGGPGQGGTFAGDGDRGHGGGGGALGGAVFGHNATITVVNSTFTGNSVVRGVSGGGDANNGRDAGGALFLVEGHITVVNSTIAGNEGTGSGGGLAVYRPLNDPSTKLELYNTIIADNGAKECFYERDVTVVGSANLITQGDGLSSPMHACPGIDVTADPLLQPLTLNAPGRVMTMAIPLNSPAVDAADPLFAPQVDGRLLLRPVGAGYDIGAFEASSVAPVTTITLEPASPDGANSWYQSPVSLTIAATDEDNDVSQTRCVLDPPSVPTTFGDLPDAACSLAAVAADGVHVVYAASIDSFGVASPLVSAAFKIDTTDPLLSPTLSSTVVQLGQTGVTALPNATDATSGIDTSSCGAVDTSTAGLHTVVCTATDRAGNSANATLDYVIEYRILGFFSPVPGSKWRAGGTVPVKLALASGGGNRISDAEATALANSCRVRFSASGAQSSPSRCMRYDAARDQFVYGWQLAKSPTGSATIRVEVTYPGTATRTALARAITITK